MYSNFAFIFVSLLDFDHGLVGRKPGLVGVRSIQAHVEYQHAHP